MRFKSIKYISHNGEEIIFGQRDFNLKHKFYLNKVEGFTKNSTRIFSSDTVDSQIRLFAGNKLSERQFSLSFTYRSNNKLDDFKQGKERKEKELVDLIRILSTTSIQTKNKTGVLKLKTINGSKFIIKGVIPESVVEVNNSLTQLNYSQMSVTFKCYDPYIYVDKIIKETMLDKKNGRILTDFVDDEFLNEKSILDFKIEKQFGLYQQGTNSNIINKDNENASSTRDGYISNKGIFFFVDEYNNKNDEKDGGMFWLETSGKTEVIVSGVKEYPFITIYGYVENPLIKNITTGREFGLNFIIREKEYVEIDMKEKTIFLFRGDSILEISEFITYESSWLYFEEGKNKIEISSDDFGKGFKVKSSRETTLEGIGI